MQTKRTPSQARPYIVVDMQGTRLPNGCIDLKNPQNQMGAFATMRQAAELVETIGRDRFAITHINQLAG